jgi:hypothetical protein
MKLVMYIHDPVGHPDPDKIAKTGGERVLFRGSNGVMSETPEGIAMEMRQTADIAQAQDSRVSDDPIEHFIFSFESSDKVGENEIRRCISIAVKHLGVTWHQYTWGAHRDTDNTHIHLAVNRINPLNFKALDIKFPVLQAEQIGARINHELGMKPMIKNRYRVNNKTQEIERVPSTAVPKPERLAEIIKTSTSWSEFHERTFKAGILYEKKGSGALINGDKASNVDRNATIIKLCKMWGNFEASPHILPKKPSPEVIERRERHERKAVRNEERGSLLKTQQQARATIIAQAKERKRALWDNKALSRNQRSAQLSFIALEQAKQLADLRDQQKKDYQTFTRSLNTTLPLIDFRKMESLVCGPSDSRPVGDIRNFTAHPVGREVEYRLKDSDTTSFIDKGRIITVTDRTDESVIAVLQLGAAKWGRELSLTGGDEFKTQAIRLAVAHGIYISNPELQDLIAQEVTRLSMERKDLGIKILNFARIKNAALHNLQFKPEELSQPQPVDDVPIEPADKGADDFEDESDETQDQDEWVPDVPKF